MAPNAIFKGLLALVMLFSSAVAYAEPSGLYIAEGLVGWSLTFNGGSATVQEQTRFSSETTLGYTFTGWLFVGGVFNYTTGTEKITDSFNLNTNHSETYQYYGPVVGYMADDWFLLGHYYVAAEKKDNVSGSGVAAPYYTDMTGSGFGLSLGYKFILGSFELGPTVDFKMITYNNCRDPVSGVVTGCNPAIQQNEISPYVTLLYNFK